MKNYQRMIDAYGVAFPNHYRKETTGPDPLTLLAGNPSPNGVRLLKIDVS